MSSRPETSDSVQSTVPVPERWLANGRRLRLVTASASYARPLARDEAPVPPRSCYDVEVVELEAVRDAAGVVTARDQHHVAVLHCHDLVQRPVIGLDPLHRPARGGVRCSSRTWPSPTGGARPDARSPEPISRRTVESKADRQADHGRGWRILGQAIRNLGILRDEVVIATKVLGVSGSTVQRIRPRLGGTFGMRESP